MAASVASTAVLDFFWGGRQRAPICVFDQDGYRSTLWVWQKKENTHRSSTDYQHEPALCTELIQKKKKMDRYSVPHSITYPSCMHTSRQSGQRIPPPSSRGIGCCCWSHRILVSNCMYTSTYCSRHPTHLQHIIGIVRTVVGGCSHHITDFFAQWKHRRGPRVDYSRHFPLHLVLHTPYHRHKHVPSKPHCWISLPQCIRGLVVDFFLDSTFTKPRFLQEEEEVGNLNRANRLVFFNGEILGTVENATDFVARAKECPEIYNQPIHFSVSIYVASNVLFFFWGGGGGSEQLFFSALQGNV